MNARRELTNYIRRIVTVCAGVVGVILIGFGVGWMAEQWRSMGGWGVATGTALGVAMGFAWIHRYVMMMDENVDDTI